MAQSSPFKAEVRFGSASIWLKAGEPLKVDGSSVQVRLRKLGDLLPVLMWPEAVRSAGDVAYYMYREVICERHKETFNAQRLRFDVTVIPPRVIGREYIKTLGHCHSESASGASYPEIYEVLGGEGTFILQRPGPDPRAIEDVVAIRAVTGDKVIVPPKYGHVTVNRSSEVLVMSNLIFRECRSIYESYVEFRGAAVHLTLDGFLPNPSYKHAPKPRELEAKPPGILDRGFLYDLFLAEPSRFKFLEEPSLLSGIDLYGTVLE